MSCRWWFDAIQCVNSPRSKCNFCETICQSNHELDFHYWKICPFLSKCENCRDVVKISDLNNHLLSSFCCFFMLPNISWTNFLTILGECTNKSDYYQCDTCQDAVLKSEEEDHKSQSHCRELTPGISKCGLCHENIYLPDDGGWERHFSIGCPKQKRKLKT